MENTIIYKTTITDFNKHLNIDHFIELCYKAKNKIVTISSNGVGTIFVRVDRAKPLNDPGYIIYWELVDIGDSEIPEELLV